MLGRLLERRAAFQELWGSGALFERVSPTGIPVNYREALRLSAVYACVRLIADTISTLPVDQYIRRDGERRPYRPKEAWVDQPCLLMDRPTFYAQVLVSLLLDGNAYCVISRDELGQVVELHVLNPTDVEPKNGQRGKTYRIKSSGRVLQANEVLHLTELLLPGEPKGVSRVDRAKDTLGLGLALEEYAGRFFGNGANAGGVIEWPKPLTQEQAKTLVDTWEGGHKGLRRSHRPAVLADGAKFVPTSVNPSESQLLEERRFAVEEVARIYRVPPFMLGVTTAGSMSFASVEQQGLFFAQHTIAPYVAKLEAAFSSLLTTPGTFLRWNLSALVRADLSTRTASYASALLAGWQSVNDVRRLEDLPPVADGDQYRVPMQNLPLSDAPLVTMKERAQAAQMLMAAGFDGPSVAQLLGIDATHTGAKSVQVQQEGV